MSSIVLERFKEVREGRLAEASCSAAAELSVLWLRSRCCKLSRDPQTRDEKSSTLSRAQLRSGRLTCGQLLSATMLQCPGPF